MESGIALTFASFLVEGLLFIAALVCLSKKTAPGARTKRCSLLIAAMSICALASLMYPAMLVRSVVTGASSLAWPYFVVFVGAPLMPLAAWAIRRGMR